MRHVRTGGKRYVNRNHLYLPRICKFTPHQSPGCQFEVATLVYNHRRLSAELRVEMVNSFESTNASCADLSRHRAQCFGSSCEHNGCHTGPSCVHDYLKS